MGIRYDISVSLSVFKLGDRCSREDARLLVVAAHVELSLLLAGYVCLGHGFEVLLDSHHILLARIVALDRDSNGNDEEDDCDDDRNDDDHF